MKKKKVTIIIPAYNEETNIAKVIDEVKKKVLYEKELIVIDDFSIDKTTEILKNLPEIDKKIFHTRNLGKGAAIKSALPYITGDIVAIQDADLEYDPKDLNKLIEKIFNQESKVVYGSRIKNEKRYNQKNFISNYRIFGNHILTIISNYFNNQNLTDAHTCYKVIDKDIFLKLNLQENDFAFCPEVTTKLSLIGEKIIELPINYNGRSVEEGKKIRFKDAVKAFYTIIKYRLFNNINRKNMRY